MRTRGAFENPLERKLRDAEIPGFRVSCAACAAWKADRQITSPFQGERELARVHHAPAKLLLEVRRVA